MWNEQTNNGKPKVSAVQFSWKTNLLLSMADRIRTNFSTLHQLVLCPKYNATLNLEFGKPFCIVKGKLFVSTFVCMIKELNG